MEPRVGAGDVLVQAGKGVTAEELAPLRAVDPRPGAYWDTEVDLTALGIAVAADVAAGGLGGRGVAIEGFDAAGPALARALAERGGRVVAVATASGTAVALEGFDPADLDGAWSEHGADLVAALDTDPGKPWAVFGAASDVLVVGSKPGIIDDRVAGGLSATVVVPGGPVPITAKGLAVARRAGRGGGTGLPQHRRPVVRGLARARRAGAGRGRGHRHRRRRGGGAGPRRRALAGGVLPSRGLPADVARRAALRSALSVMVSTL